MNTKPVIQAVEPSATGADFLFWCPGCEQHHGVWTTKSNANGARWTFNGNMVEPSFNPSFLIRGDEKSPRCHSIIKAGLIMFLSDSSHKLCGKTVKLKPIDEALEVGG